MSDRYVHKFLRYENQWPIKMRDDMMTDGEAPKKEIVQHEKSTVQQEYTVCISQI